MIYINRTKSTKNKKKKKTRRDRIFLSSLNARFVFNVSSHARRRTMTVSSRSKDTIVISAALKLINRREKLDKGGRSELYVSSTTTHNKWRLRRGISVTPSPSPPLPRRRTTWLDSVARTRPYIHFDSQLFAETHRQRVYAAGEY